MVSATTVAPLHPFLPPHGSTITSTRYCYNVHIIEEKSEQM